MTALRSTALGVFALLTLAFTALPASAQALYAAGKHYDILEAPVTTNDPSKVEVVEVFWYGCPHCYHFEPLLTKWKEQQQDDVDFVSYPAIWNKKMELHALMFFTAQALGVMDKVHEPIFKAMVIERKRLDSPKKIEELFAGYGVSSEDFQKAFNSFGVKGKAKTAAKRSREYKITGTPEMVVNGKYRVSASMAGGQAQMLKVVDFLVEKERRKIPVS